MRRLSVVLLLSALMLFAAPGVVARTESRAVGSPSSGRLVDGVRFEETENLRRVTGYRRSANRYATRELIELLQRAADRVAQLHPGASLSVGDLSAEQGGPIPYHRSHQNGRDADVSFYLLHENGRVLEPRGFVHFGDDGIGEPPLQMIRFDDARNWELMAALASEPPGIVQVVFVNRGLEERLVAEGRRRGADEQLLQRVERMVRQPRVRHPHRNHFHVRIACPPDDRPRCRDHARR